MSVATLGTNSDEQSIDGIGLDEPKRYIHHYNFPPFSVGEARQLRGVSRRDIGHGALAERALVAVLPSEKDFPYVIRVVSETLSSNGSSSMASACGSTLALLDAGVPLKAMVGGVAMGLITEDGTAKGKYAILTDIQGFEDALGDMDFKVTGTRTGVTAIQMDIKVDGLTEEILGKALAQAKEGRLVILDKMEAVISEPRAEVSRFAPRITTIKINPGQDPRDHRPRRQDDPQDHRGDQDHHRHSGRWLGQYRLEQRREHPESRRLDPLADPRGRSRRDLHRQSHPRPAIRRVRRDRAGQRRAWCTSRSWRTIACRVSRTSSRSATKSRSWSPRSTARVGSTCRGGRCSNRPKMATRAAARTPAQQRR